MTEDLQQEIRTLRSLFESSRDPEGRVFAPLADAYRRAGDVSEALRLLNDGIARHPDFVPGHVVAAELYLEQGLTAEAGLAARKALDLDGENVLALRSLFHVLHEGDDALEAADVRGRLALLEPEMADELPMVEGLPEVVEEEEPPAEVATADEAPAADEGLIDISGMDTSMGLGEPVLGLGDLDPSDEEVYSGSTLLDSDALTVSDEEDVGSAEYVSSGTEPRVDEPVMDLEDLSAPDDGEFSPMTLADLSSESTAEGVAAEEEAGAAGIDEPVVSLDDLAPVAEEATDEPVMELGALAPDEPETAEEPVMELGALAPDEPETAEEPVMELGALAPDEPETADEPVMELGALAPDEPETADEPVMELGALAPDEPETAEEPVMELGALAPDEPETADEPVMELGALAPDEPDGDSTDGPVIDMDELRAGSRVQEDREDEEAAPVPSAQEAEEPHEEAEESDEPAAAAEPEEHPSPDRARVEALKAELMGEDDEEEGEPVYTRTLADLYVKQGAVEKALDVLRRLQADSPDDEDLAERIAKLESGDVSDEAEGGDEDLEDALAASTEEVEAELSEPPAVEDDAPETEPVGAGEPENEGDGSSIRDYFDGLLTWEPGEHS